MNKITKGISIVTSSLVVLSMSTVIFASNSDEIWSSQVNLKGEKPISTYVSNSENDTKGNIQTMSISTRSVQFVHDSGFEYHKNGTSGDPDERVWGETSHLENGKGVNGYTRARYEKGNSIKADSGRCWDDDDGQIDGYSKAKSNWMSTFLNFYTGHTYYGN